MELHALKVKSMNFMVCELYLNFLRKKKQYRQHVWQTAWQKRMLSKYCCDWDTDYWKE